MSTRSARWTHSCAWDGHELAETEDFVQVSSHERVCQDHYPQFQTWLRDKSKTMYRVTAEDELSPGEIGEFDELASRPVGWRRIRDRRFRGRRRQQPGGHK